ncbi:Holliday junction branch migration protein RuvA [Yunchengibacter salinarum]|uniref:Holliday junction branch migration protein RuvA n=1 Tax=Yunchengibacter salinarum TaxID=3133399 RepID=UPI0035B63C5B
MIAKLTGLVDSVDTDSVVVDVGGVGYLVHASSRTLANLPGAGEATRLFLETVVREDAFLLYGFTDRQDRDMFRLLTSVQGVGARVALAIQSVLSPGDLHNAIAAQDKASVARANGVGPKLAGRIVNELKDKVAGIAATGHAGLQAGQAGAGGAVAGGVAEDVTSALVNLGYKPGEAHGAAVKAVRELGDGAEVATVLPIALKSLSPG